MRWISPQWIYFTIIPLTSKIQIFSAFSSRAWEAAVGVEGDVGQAGGGQEHGAEREAQAWRGNSSQAGIFQI